MDTSTENNNITSSMASLGLEEIQSETDDSTNEIPEALQTTKQTNNDFNSNIRSSIFNQRRYDLFEQLRNSVEECEKHFKDGIEFATDDNQIVQNLCINLELAFEYGLKSHSSQTTVSIENMYRNMQEIFNLSGNSNSAANSNNNFAGFWAFCQMFLTEFDKERFDQLQHINTLEGKGRAFIRTSLNEQSLAFYMANWFSKMEHLHLHYSPWSLLTDTSVSAHLLQLIENLNNVLFALEVDKPQFNSQAVLCQENFKTSAKDEPIIYAPLLPKADNKSKNSLNAVNRPITTATHNTDLFHYSCEDECDESAAIDIARHNIESELNFFSGEVNKTIDEVSPLSVDNNFTNFQPPASPVVTVSSNSLEECNSDDDAEGDSTSEFSNSVSNQVDNVLQMKKQLEEVNQRCCQLEDRVQRLTLENNQLLMLVQQRFQIASDNINTESNAIKNFQIIIPNAKLHQCKRSANNYYLYEIRITMLESRECWSLWRRYNDFYKLHKSLFRTHPSVAAVVRFPPKKRFGNLNIKFVEQRRKHLQYYIHHLIDHLPLVQNCKTKTELLKAFPFLRDHSCLPQL